MSKWRPSDNCIYVIPDIHGMAKQLKLILNRILPLRNTGGHLDKIIFLGDYIDRRISSPTVIDLVKDVNEKFPDQVICLKGNHERMMLDAIKRDATLTQYNMWMQNGGEETLIGYMKKAGSELDNPYLIKRQYISRFIPDDHMDFFMYLKPYYEMDGYIFVHGGCDPFVPLRYQNEKALSWDRSVYASVRAIHEGGGKCNWDKTIITGHNGEQDGKPFICDKFMMLDGSYAEILYVFELNSMTGYSARKNNKRLVKESIS